MDRFSECLEFVLKWEGDEFTNDPDDRGGATRYGITQKEYSVWCRARGIDAKSVEHISRDEVGAIYRSDYWIPVSAQRMPVPLDMFMFDSAVQHGPARAARFLQRALSVDADGRIGSNTMSALREEIISGSVWDVVSQAISIRRDFYEAIVQKDPTQKKWLKGWNNRLNDLAAKCKSDSE